jgi:hypothetical protein
MRAVRRDEEIIGIAPLLMREKAVSFVGSADVCDYLDFIVAPIKSFKLAPSFKLTVSSRVAVSSLSRPKKSTSIFIFPIYLW